MDVMGNHTEKTCEEGAKKRWPHPIGAQNSWIEMNCCKDLDEATCMIENGDKMCQGASRLALIEFGKQKFEYVHAFCLEIGMPKDNWHDWCTERK